MIIISSCLAGTSCRYDGTAFPTPYTDLLQDLVQSGLAVQVCPEVTGGLPTPRPSAEIIKGRVCISSGEDITESFQSGCEKVLETLRSQEKEPVLAILKSRSPSCGVSTIYDGTFSSKLIEGSGLFMQNLKRTYPNLKVIDETQLKEFEQELISLLLNCSIL